MSKLFSDKPKYFNIQYVNSKNSIIPFINDIYTPKPGDRILEIGSAEGGVLKAFTELRCVCTGIELADYRVDLANDFMAEEVKSGLVEFICEDIYDIDPNALEKKYDLIILKDVIEHIHDQKKFMNRVGEFLDDNGIIFFGFPSWKMPYGGHQQCAHSKVMAKMPYYHLLPKFLYKFLLKSFGESDAIVEGLLEIKDTGISTKRFEKICGQTNFKIVKSIKYFIAPIYEYKFGYKTKVLPKWIASIPFFNDFFTFQSYYVVRK